MVNDGALCACATYSFEESCCDHIVRVDPFGAFKVGPRRTEEIRIPLWSWSPTGSVRDVGMNEMEVKWLHTLCCVIRHGWRGLGNIQSEKTSIDMHDRVVMKREQGQIQVELV